MSRFDKIALARAKVKDIPLTTTALLNKLERLCMDRVKLAIVPPSRSGEKHSYSQPTETVALYEGSLVSKTAN